jgi:type IV pilus assembly protein PilQ
LKYLICLILLWVNLLICIAFASSTDVQSTNHKLLPNHPIQMNFDDISISDTFRLMAKLGNIEMMGLEKIEGRCSVHFNNIPWQVAFAYLLANHGLSSFHQENLIIIGTPKELQEIKNYFPKSLNQAHSTKSQQVLIEARIVEADYRFARNLGVKLGYQLQESSKIQGKFSSDLSTNGLNGFDSPIAAITMLKKGVLPFLDFELSALESDGQGNIIANPRIVTANKTLATIEQGTELPYQSSSKEGAKVQFRKANLKLEVTPTIEDQHILLDVEISKDSIGMKTEQGFAINTKHLKSQILVEDGGTVVIGGIYLQTEREDIVKIPLLGDIPYFGRFFQHQTKLRDKTELLVFLTPSLIDHHGRYLNNPK